jgi:hypothetical protein
VLAKQMRHYKRSAREVSEIRMESMSKATRVSSRKSLAAFQEIENVATEMATEAIEAAKAAEIAESWKTSSNSRSSLSPGGTSSRYYSSSHSSPISTLNSEQRSCYSPDVSMDGEESDNSSTYEHEEDVHGRHPL